MGYTTTNYSALASDMQQTPHTVEMVLDFAGWTVEEAAREIDVKTDSLLSALHDLSPLTDLAWQKLLDVAGRRAFDHDEESA